MTTTGRYSIVVYKAHNQLTVSKLSKIFRVKQQARSYAADMIEKEKGVGKDWVVVDIEAILD